MYPKLFSIAKWERKIQILSYSFKLILSSLYTLIFRVVVIHHVSVGFNFTCRLLQLKFVKNKPYFSHPSSYFSISVTVQTVFLYLTREAEVSFIFSFSGLSVYHFNVSNKGRDVLSFLWGSERGMRQI